MRALCDSQTVTSTPAQEQPIAARGQPRRKAWPRYAGVVGLWAAWAFVLLLSAVLAHFYDRFPGDEFVASRFQRLDVPALGGYLAFVNALGNAWVRTALVAGVVLSLGLRHRGWESLLALYAFVPVFVNAFIKGLVERPRPSEELVAVTETVSGFGFPSGHTVSTSALFVVLLFSLPAIVQHRLLRRLLQAGCVLMIISAGPARVYVGAHWPSDVLAAYLLAMLMVLPLLWVYRSRIAST